MKRKHIGWISLLVTTAAIAAGSYGDFLGVLAKRESSGNQYAQTPNGGTYIGLYQMGPGALTDAGYMKNGTWTGKNGINSREDYFASVSAQTDSVTVFQQGLEKQILASGYDKYIGQTVGGVEITMSGMIAASHLGGKGNLDKFFASNGEYVFRDGVNQKGTPITEYMSKFGGYNSPSAGAVANLAASVVGTLQSAFGLTPTYGVGLGQDIGNPGTVCSTDYFVSPACYIIDPCNLTCLGATGNDARVGTVSAGSEEIQPDP